MIVLQNRYIRVCISELFSLTEVLDISTGRNYIDSDEAGIPLFRITLSEFVDGKIQSGEITITSCSATEVAFERVRDTVTLRFTRLDNLPIDVTCLIRTDPEKPLSYWGLEIKNASAFAIRSVEYPVIRSILPLSGNGSNDRILMPKADGYLLPSPLVQEWEGDYPFRRYNQRFGYPGEGRQFPENLCAQVLAYYDDLGGLYIATYDGEGHPKRLGPIQVHTDHSSTIDFSPVHIFPELPGKDRILPYETVVGCFEGDWQDAADMYKSWSITQPWCSKTLVERTDVPEWIKAGAYFFNFRLRNQEDRERFLARVPDYLEMWRNYLGMPLVAMMVGWEKHGEWLGPDYFPPYGGENFAEMCRALRRKGMYPFPFGLSGLKLPIRKRIGRDWPQPELAIDYDNRSYFEKHYTQHAAIDRNGNVIKDSSISSWDGLHGYACVRTKQAREQLLEASCLLVKEYNSVVIQADQIFGGAVSECYSPDHEHPMGRGRWQVQSLKEIYADMRSQAKALNPDFALSQEFPSELYIQDLDVCHGRVSDQPRGMWGVPLFAYLYHEYLSCYGGDWSSLLPDNTCGVYVQANNFVFGSQCAGTPQTPYIDVRNSEPDGCRPETLQMAKQTCALFQSFTQYLVYGKMLKSRPLNVPDIDVTFVGMDFSGWRKKTIAVSSVLHCAWEAPDGSVAYTLANISNENRSFQLPLIKDSRRQKLHTYSVQRILESSIQETIQVSLGPLEAAILEMY